MKSGHVFTFVMTLASAITASAADGCSVAQVMKTIHSQSAYRKFKYAGNYNQTQGPPTQKQHENNDQYLFWVDDNGQTFPAIVTYDSGSCLGGAAVVKTSQGE